MGIMEGIVAITTIICISLVLLCYIYSKGDDKNAMEERSTKKMGK